MKFPKSVTVFLVATVMLIATPARAVPVLQLDIYGGTYDTSTETVMASSNSFSLYAYGLSTGSNAISLTDSFFLSMALVPMTSLAGNYGSFTINGITVNVTGDMTYGNPPLETILGGAEHDGGDLGPHSIFPTYFAEQMFTFSAGNQSGVYNTQDDAGLGPQAGTGMYYKKFDFDISGLAAGYGLHFDLYNEKIKSSGDIDINKFAPFSHDAGAMVMTPIPEPETYAMLIAGLGLLGFVARRRRLSGAAA